MAEVIICGQAPSRVGQGLPFQGPSGRRLAALVGVHSREKLLEKVTLANLFDKPAELRVLPPERRATSYTSVGDQFDRQAARKIALDMMAQWREEGSEVIVVACGHAVYQAFTNERGIFYKGKRSRGVEVWCFPHPSGVSSYWNRRVNRITAANNLKRILKRAGHSIDE